MGAVVVDTSVLLGVLDPGDALHAAARDAVLAHRAAGHTLVIPASVLAEALVGANRQGPAVAQRVEAAIDVLVDDVLPIDRPTTRSAAALRARQPVIRLPDALVLAAGRQIGALAVLTGDKRWLGVDDRVELITPT
ncbi:type II toxin-antitoxin system VapC family toxin [Streptomyces sp. NPDC092296]|uniref:type II toxin-antitoxin system VapC family toxin n=1 Tax=Streptomyces sp. NPDC092296 TaxID=3366012 RepID=UPI00380BA305